MADQQKVWGYAVQVEYFFDIPLLIIHNLLVQVEYIEFTPGLFFAHG